MKEFLRKLVYKVFLFSGHLSTFGRDSVVVLSYVFALLCTGRTFRISKLEQSRGARQVCICLELVIHRFSISYWSNQQTLYGGLIAVWMLIWAKSLWNLWSPSKRSSFRPQLKWDDCIFMHKQISDNDKSSLTVMVLLLSEQWQCFNKVEAGTDSSRARKLG